MEKEAQELLKWLDDVTKYQLPTYDQLPHVPLYMEQVVGYINDVLGPLTPDEKKQLTSFMVNNYVKAKMIQEPDKKKYGENQLGYLDRHHSSQEHDVHERDLFAYGNG
jgi:hypothetical protein